MDENMVTMQPAAPKPQKGKLILILCAVLLVAAVAIGSVSAVLAADPMKQMEKAFANSAKAAQPASVERIADMLKDGGSMEISWDAGLLMADLTGLPLDIDAVVKFFVDYEAQKSAMTADVNYGAMSLVDVLVTADSEHYAVASEALLGDAAYGVDMTKFEENLPGSVLAQDEELAAYMQAVLEQYNSAMQNQKTAQAEALALYAEMYGVLKTSLKEHAVISKESGELTVGGEAVPTNNVKITADAAAIAAIAEDVLLYVRDSEKLEAYIDTYGAGAALESGMSAEELKAELRLAIEDALVDIRAIDPETEKVAAEVTVHISKAKKQVIGVTAAITDEYGATSWLDIVCGPSMDALTEISIATRGTSEDVSLSYLVEENSDSTYRAKLSAMDEVILTVSGDKANDTFTLKVFSESGDLTLTGSFIDTDEQYGIVFETAEMEGQTIRLGNITLAVNDTDEMPEIGAFTEIMTMSEEELEALVAQVETAIQTLASAFVG